MKEGLINGEIQRSIPKIDMEKLSPIKILADGLKIEEINPFVKKMVTDYFQQEKYKVNVKQFNEKWEDKSVVSNLKQRLHVYGLLGSLKNITLGEFMETDEKEKLCFLSREKRGEKKAFIVSADYYSNDNYKGKIFNMFYFNVIRTRSSKVVPSFTFSLYVQLPLSVAENLNREKRKAWISNKNSFEQ